MAKTDRYAYIKVLVSAFLMVGASIGLCFYSAGSFYDPLAGGLQVSVGQASASTTVMLVFMALTALIVPSLLKKMRFFVYALIGTALCAGSVLMIAFSFNIAWTYFFSALMGVGAALIGMVPANTLVQNWFVRRRATATSIVLGGSALSAAIFSPIFSAAVSTFGWRMGFVLEAALVLVMLLPLLLWKIELTPAQAGMLPYGHGHEAAAEPDTRKIPNFVLWTFALIAFLSAILIALPMHFSTLATSIGRPAILGASMLSAAMIGNFIFKLVGGWVSARLKPVWTTALFDLFALVSSIGILIAILAVSSNAMIPLAFLYGSAYALSELSLPLLVSVHVKRRHFTVLYSVLNCISTLTTAVSIMVIGFMYDGLRSYIWMYAIAIAAEVVIAFLLWTLIRNSKADNLVNSEATRSLVVMIRDLEARHKAAQAKRAAERKEKQRLEKERQAQQENEKKISEESIAQTSVVVPAEKSEESTESTKSTEPESPAAQNADDSAAHAAGSGSADETAADAAPVKAESDEKKAEVLTPVVEEKSDAEPESDPAPAVDAKTAEKADSGKDQPEDSSSADKK